MSQPSISRILVRKSERRLALLDPSGAVVCEFPIILGSSALGTKQIEGDRRTPEGDYYVCVKNPQSKFHLSVGINYPSSGDARRGLDAGLIDPEQYAAIAAAEAERRRPPWDTPLGGEIFIHGDAAGREGTRGCIALSNEAIERIYALVEHWTPIRIDP